MDQSQEAQFQMQARLERVLDLRIKVDGELQPAGQVFFAELCSGFTHALLLGWTGGNEPGQLAGDPGDKEVAEVAREFAAVMLQVPARGLEFLDDFEHGGRRTGFECGRHRAQRFERKHAEQAAHVGAGQFVAATGDGLVESGKGIADAALAGLGKDGQRFGVGLDALLLADPLHAADDCLEFNRTEAELLASRSDRRGNLVRFSGAEQEDGPLGRLFQRLEQRIEGFAGDLVGFVDDEDLVAVARRAVADVFAQLAHLVDAAVRRRVDLDHVGGVVLRDLDAGRADAAGRNGRPLDAVQAAGEDTRDCRFAGAALARQDVAMRDTALLNCVLEGGADMLLPDDAGEVMWPELAGADLVGLGSWIGSACGHVGDLLNARPRVIRGTRFEPLPLLPSGPGGVCGLPLHGARGLTINHATMRPKRASGSGMIVRNW